MIYPENFEEKIGFAQIRTWLKENCLSELGKDAVNEMLFMSNHSLLDNVLNQVVEFKHILGFQDNFPVDHYFDVRQALKKLNIEGAFIEKEEIFDLGRSLETIKSILNFFKQNNEQYPALYNLCGNISVYPFVLQKIQSILTNNGKIKDNASAELASIRKLTKNKQSEASKRILQIFKHVQSSGWTDDDASVTIREGRAVIPVNVTNKRMIKGYILDESSTGKTVYIEPVEVFELNNEIRELEYAERREIIKILIEFTNDIRPYKDDLFKLYEFLKRIDFIRAKAKLAQKIESIKPKLKNEPGINWEDAVHPVLYVSHKSENKPIVPLTISLTSEKRILLISGPNAGGKSVCLKTVGLVQYMLQCGLLIPVNVNSEAGIFNNIFIDIGDEQSIENDLSTYSSHLMNMKYFMKNAENKTLILIDEFGSGTEPHIGGALAESLLEKFNENKSFGVVTTHYSNLKHFASSAEGIVNGAMLYDTQNMKPMFKLSIGGPGSSFAFEIARNIGISEDVLQKASEKTGGGHVQFDKHLREVLREKRYLERKRFNIRKLEKQLEEKIAKYSGELEQIEKLRKEVLNKSRDDVNNVLKELNKKIESTIREIKEANAEKDRTRQARKELKEFTDNVNENLCKDDDNIHKKIKELNKLTNNKSAADNSKKTGKKENEIEAGSKVRIKGQETVGEVIELNKNSVMVACGNIITTIDISKLELVSESEYKKTIKLTGSSGNSRVELYNKKLKFKPDIDIRGKRVQEALTEIAGLIDDAVMVNAQQIRVLHGTGNGILKQALREYLNTVDVVKSCKDEHIERGGAGITIVEIEF